jgi:hypothetical protein
LLKQMVDSFCELNSYPIEEIIIIEDSGNLDMKDKITNYFGNKVKLIYNDKTLGQAKSIDKLYNCVKSDYIFHSEDDYLYEGNSNFLKDSIDILEERSDIHQIWLRYWNDYDDTHGTQFLSTILEDNELTTITGVKYKMIKSPHYGWCGFSWNSGLRRLIDYKNMFPNGFQEHIKNNEVGSLAESLCDKIAASNNYRAAYLVNPACKDKGRNNSTYHQNATII